MTYRGDFFKHNQCLRQTLHACTRTPAFKTIKPLHALTITSGSTLDQPIYFYNNVISVYTSLGELSSASKVFDKMSDRNVVSFNTMIGAHSKFDQSDEAWKVFFEMRSCGFLPTQFTLGGLLSCKSLDMCRVVCLHALSVKNGLFCADAFVGTAILDLYGRYGLFDEAVQAFEDMPNTSLVTLNSMISLFAKHDCFEDCITMFRELVRLQDSLSECSFIAVLSGVSSARDLHEGEQVYALVIKYGLEHAISVVNCIINMYLKCADVCSAERVFEDAPVKDVVSWNILLGALAKSDDPIKALEQFAIMPRLGVSPNQTTYVTAINSCTNLLNLEYGQFLHAKIIKNAFERDMFLGSVLIDFYAKCGKLREAHHCFESFDDISETNVVSWNALILGYANKFSSTSLSLLLEMRHLGFQPNEFTYSGVLKSLSLLELKQTHCLIMKTGYINNEYVLSSLMTSYAKVGFVKEALTFLNESCFSVDVVQCNVIAGMFNRTGQYNETVKLLSLLEEPDSISWNIVITACARNGDYKEVFELFKHMRNAQVSVDNYTFVNVLSVCSKLCNLALGSCIHGLIIKTDFSSCDTFLYNILIDMYGKCGSVESCLKIFERVTDSRRSVITWTTLISALGIHGYVHDTFDCFRKMLSFGIKPDGVVFIAMLTACRHGGLVKEGMELLREMRSVYGVEPEMDHYRCGVDMFARCGYLKEAEQLISSMPFPPDAQIWRSFLEGCNRYRNAKDQNLESFA